MTRTQKLKLATQMLAIGLTAFLIVERARAQTYTISSASGVDFEAGWNLTIDGSHNSYSLGIANLTPASPSTGPVIKSVSTDILANTFLTDNTHTYIYTYVQNSFATAPPAGVDPLSGSDNAGKQVNNPVGANYYDSATANAAIQNAALIFNSNSAILTSGTVQQKAALQLAVWTVLYDTGPGQNWNNALFSGRFHILNIPDPTVVTDAINMLKGALGTAGNSPQQFIGGLLTPNPSIQYGFISDEWLLTPTPVPEPTTVLAGMLLLLPFGGSALRFARKHNAA